MRAHWFVAAVFGEKEDSRQETPPGDCPERFSFRQYEQHHRADEVIKHRLSPDGRRAVLRKQIFKPMRAESPKRQGERTGSSGNTGGKGRSINLGNYGASNLHAPGRSFPIFRSFRIIWIPLTLQFNSILICLILSFPGIDPSILNWI